MRMGERIKNAQKYAGDKTTKWSSTKVNRGSSDRCPGCQKKYKDMTAAEFNRHQKADFDCPDT